jgi:succinate-acetate transporter protein
MPDESKSPMALFILFVLITYSLKKFHVVVMLTLSVAFIVSAIVVFKKQQILRSILMVLGFIGTILGGQGRADKITRYCQNSNCTCINPVP